MSIDTPKENDHFETISGVPVSVCSESFEYLKGSEIHFDDGLSGKGFEIAIQMLNLHVVVASLSVESIYFLSSFFLSFPSFLSAGEGKLVKNGPVSTRFVVEKNIHPQSKIIEIGWWMKREKNWHTYWESPGDVGVPPTLKWELPKGIIFKKISYAPRNLLKCLRFLLMVIVMKPFLYALSMLIENLRLVKRLNLEQSPHG